MPRFVEEDLYYIDEKTGEWKLKEGAPEWAKKEFEEFFRKVKAEPDENRIVTQY